MNRYRLTFKLDGMPAPAVHQLLHFDSRQRIRRDALPVDWLANIQSVSIAPAGVTALVKGDCAREAVIQAAMHLTNLLKCLEVDGAVYPAVTSVEALR